jgi:hypothetical protein
MVNISGCVFKLLFFVRTVVIIYFMKYQQNNKHSDSMVNVVYINSTVYINYYSRTINNIFVSGVYKNLE